jgi:hypothetical protein
MESTLTGFKDYLNTGWGKRATHLLREGATIKVLVDKSPFFLSKHEGKMEMTPGDPKSYGVLLEVSSAAIEDLCSAKAEADAQERLEQLIYHPTPERYARMKIEVEPTEKGRIDFYYNGYFFWARRMRFVN